MTYLVGLGVFLTFGLSLGRCLWGAAANRWVVGLRTSSSATSSQRLVQWVALPLVGYLLAIVCNLGTGMLASDWRGALIVLQGGALALALTGALIALRPPSRAPWNSVGSWEALQAEVEDQQALGQQPAQVWLDGARRTQKRLAACSRRPQQLAARARHLLHGVVVPGVRCPQWGLGVLKDAQGSRIPVPWMRVARWSIRDRWSLAVVVCAVATVALAAVAPATPRTPSGGGVELAVAWLAALVLTSVLAARASLLYYARLHLEWRGTAQAINTVLGRWERAARRSRRLPRRQPTR